MAAKPKWHKQVNVNTKRMKALMRDIRADVERRTRNSKDLDAWMEKLAPYIASNCFNTGEWADSVREIVSSISGTIDRTSLPAGSNAELMKGVMSEATMTMVTNVGEDIKTELQQIAVESYNAKNTPAETAKLIGERIDTFDKTRCQTIARTETIRAGNCANYLNAKEDNMRSFTMDCDPDACDYCVDLYYDGDLSNEPVRFSIDDYEDLPPVHPNCRCVPLFWPDPVEEEGDKSSEEGGAEEQIENEDYQLNNREDSFSNVEITPEQFENVINHQSKRENAKLEFGNVIDNTTGELVHSKDIRGKKHTVSIPTHSNPYSVIHNHTNNNGFSGGDAFSHTDHSKQEVCYATTPKGVWIMRDTEFGRFRKENNGVTEDYNLKYKMEGKYRELSNESKAKYQKDYELSTNGSSH